MTTMKQYEMSYGEVKRRVHANSISSWNEEKKNGPPRMAIIYRNIVDHGPATDRQIMVRLGFHDMNQVRPSITRLIDEGLLREDGNEKCNITGRKVRRVDISRWT